MDWWIILLMSIAVFVTVVLLTPILMGVIYRRSQNKAPTGRLDGKTIIVTGASAGIGKETTLALAKMGPRIIMACRNLKKAQPVADDIIAKTGNNNIVVKHLDLSDLDSVRKFAAEINEEEPHLHILVNNAGIVLGSNERKLSPQGFEMMMATNHYGTFLLTILLLGKLKASAPSRIITLSSSGHELYELDIDDLNYEKRPYSAMRCYSQSKLCNILFAKQLALKLEGTNVASYSVHPGLVNSELFSKDEGLWLTFSNGLVKVVARTQEQGAQSSIYLCVSDDIKGKPGDYFVNCNPHKVKNKAADLSLAKKLWEVTAKDVKLTEAEAAVFGK